MYAMVQRFPTRDAKEFMNMFVLTPLEETVTVKNIVAKSTLEAEARGERIGQIHLQHLEAQIDSPPEAPSPANALEPILTRRRTLHG